MAAFVSFERSARGKTVKSFVFLFLFPSVIEGVGLGIVLLNSSFYFSTSSSSINFKRRRRKKKVGVKPNGVVGQMTT